MPRLIYTYFLCFLATLTLFNSYEYSLVIIKTGLCLALFTWGLTVIHQGSIELRLNTIDKYLLLIFAYVYIQSWFSPYHFNSIQGFNELIFYLMIYYAGLYVSRDTRDVSKIMVGIAIIASLQSCIGVVQFFLGQQVRGTFFSMNFFAGFIAMCVPLTLNSLLWRASPASAPLVIHKRGAPTPALTTIKLCAVIIQILSIVVSGSRGAFLAMLAGAGVYLFFNYRRIFLWALAGLALCLALIPNPLSTRLKDGTQGDPFLYSRAGIWKQGLNITRDHLWFGTGVNLYTFVARKHHVPTPQHWTKHLRHAHKPHNQYIYWLSELGAIGFLLIGAATWAFLCMLIKHYKTINNDNKYLVIALAASLAAVATQGLVTENMEDMGIGYISSFVCGLLVFLLCADHKKIISLHMIRKSVLYSLLSICTIFLLYVGLHRSVAYFISQRADYLEFTKKTDQSQKYYQVSTAITPGAANYQFALGRLHFRKQEAKQGLERMQEAVRLNPISSKLYNSLAEHYAAVGLQEDAQKAFEQALKLQPTNVFTMYELAKIAWLNNQQEKSIALLKRAIEIEPYYLAARWKLAELSFIQGDKAGAKAQLKEILDRKDIPKPFSRDEYRLVQVPIDQVESLYKSL